MSKQRIKPYGIREENGARWLLWQVWDPHPPTYDVTIYVVEDRGEPTSAAVHVMRSTHYAVGVLRLIELMTDAGYAGVRRLDGGFFQPMIVGTRPRKDA